MEKYGAMKLGATKQDAPPPRMGSKSAELTRVQQRDAEYARLARDYVADSSIPEALRTLAHDARVTVRRGGAHDAEGKCVVYWMQRAQRGRDNHALDKAIEVANALGLPCVVYFAAISNFPHANLRHYAFLNQGLPDVEDDCAARNVSFFLRCAEPEKPKPGKPGREDHMRFFADVGAAFVVGDENPMREPEQWRVRIAAALRVPFWTVDADVIVPSKLLEKAQFSAGVARPRLYRALPEFLQPYKNPDAKKKFIKPRELEHDDPRADITLGWRDFDRSVAPVAAWKGGHRAAVARLEKFVTEMLVTYDRDRNHPELDGTSAMSVYLHYGHIGPLTIALAINAAVAKDPKLKLARDSYFNELIAWRELSVNFVRYQPEYDSTACADNWAKLTIAKHDEDERERLYTLKQMEEAQTYDELWNAAQLQMVHHGWMHNYMRMYWGKKIVEWTPNAAAAMKASVYLNDKYFIDGRDPNGYSGIAWAVLGKFDRAWGERPVFGKRRFMSGVSTSKKFDSKTYIEQMKALA
jgi:deoxyribodipyrimidine photo-lyase